MSRTRSLSAVTDSSQVPPAGDLAGLFAGVLGDPERGFLARPEATSGW